MEVRFSLPEKWDRVPDYIASGYHCSIRSKIDDFTAFVFLTGKFWSNFTGWL